MNFYIILKNPHYLENINDITINTIEKTNIGKIDTKFIKKFGPLSAGCIFPL